MRKDPPRTSSGSAAGARRVYLEAYNCGRTGRPQPGSHKYAAEARRGWQAGRDEYNQNRQLALFAEQAGRDAEFNRACDKARDELVRAGKRILRPGPDGEQTTVELVERGDT
jgi:hypothetical protein